MSTFFFSSSKAPSSVSSFPSFSTHSSSSPIHTFSESMMEGRIENAKPIITKWNLNSSSYTKAISVFGHNRKEAKELLKSVKDLFQAMHFLVSENSPSHKLVLAQTLMQIAMERLEHEFYQILSKHCDQLNPKSVSGQSSDESRNSDNKEASEDEDELKRAGKTITEEENVSQLAMSDLKAIAECMISSGYGKECIKIYKLIRKSIVDEGLHQLRIEQFKASRIQKMNWEVLEYMIKNWLSAVKIAVKTLFSGEKVLCDHVLSASDTIRESCFSHITEEGAMNLFRFPEFIAKGKKSQEKIFRQMELYEALTDLWPEIELIFNYDSTSAIKLQALSSQQKLGDSIQTILYEFESRIRKDLSKTPTIGGGIHPLTESAMCFICSLGDHSEILSEIFAEHPPRNSTITETNIGSSTSNHSSASPASVHLAWLIFVLLCKLDRKAEPCRKDLSLSYLFLANNLNFIIEKVRTSHLKDLFGEEWMSMHNKKLKQYALNYETVAWTKVFSSLPEKSSSPIPPDAAKECFRRFHAAFEEAYMKQTSWNVPDGKLRDELKISIAKKLVPAYREFFDTYIMMVNGDRNLEVLVRFGPAGLENYLSDLFLGTHILLSSSSSLSCSSSLGCIIR
ncbi:exocyst complex component EXO70H1-like [Mangifera indica]|uniref:exocyst complex component EXO70H1-like n=1 Tax=Mangifera indica TaxID=29780 RepID=UPI001CFB7C6C|nr:exocyst complex component EXO70H1-like [Mangifera indica]